MLLERSTEDPGDHRTHIYVQKLERNNEELAKVKHYISFLILEQCVSLGIFEIKIELSRDTFTLHVTKLCPYDFTNLHVLLLIIITPVKILLWLLYEIFWINKSLKRSADSSSL